MKNIIPILISHHPICDKYAKDMVGSKHPICRGCIFFYPSILISAILSIAILDISNSSKELNQIRILIGLGSLSFYFLKILIKNLPQFVDDLIHIITGMSISFACVSLFWGPFPLAFKIIIPIQIQLWLAIASYRRIVKMDKICNKCSFVELGKKCPGFTQISLPQKKKQDEAMTK